MREAVLCVGQPFSAELTLRWNSVRGLQGIGTMGRLIPFIVGGWVWVGEGR